MRTDLSIVLSFCAVRTNNARSARRSDTFQVGNTASFSPGRVRVWNRLG